jgi:hypothetical protein
VTDRVAAGLEIITPKLLADEIMTNSIQPVDKDVTVKLGTDGKFILATQSDASVSAQPVITFDSAGNAVFAGTITADKIRANQIEGLEMYTDKLLSLSTLYSGLATASAGVAGQPVVSGSSTILTSSTGPTETPVASASSAGNQPFTFTSLVEFIQNVIIRGTVNFFGDVVFNGHVAFDADTAGTVIIPRSTLTTDVVFAKPYETAPVVTLTVMLQDATDSAFLSDAANVAVAGVTGKGFTVVLDSPIPRDMSYNWTAIAVKNKTTTVGESIDSILGTETTVTPTSTLLPTMVPTNAPTPVPPAPVSPAPAPPAPVSPTPAPPVSVMVPENTLGFISLRRSSAPDAQELQQIPSGKVLSVLGVQGDWYAVTYNDITGWVSSADVTTR